MKPGTHIILESDLSVGGDTLAGTRIDEKALESLSAVADMVAVVGGASTGPSIGGLDLKGAKVLIRCRDRKKGKALESVLVEGRAEVKVKTKGLTRVEKTRIQYSSGAVSAAIAISRAAGISDLEEEDLGKKYDVHVLAGRDWPG